MAFNREQIKSSYHKAIQWLRDKRILKGSRITYKVIWNMFLIFISVGLIFSFFAGGLAFGYFASLVQDQKVLSKEQMNQSVYNYSETSTVYFAGNKELGELRSDVFRNEISIDKVSPHLKHALVATEDDLFYEHSGVVPKAVFRAAYQELTNQPIVTGGSTLTQQLVKNQILTDEVSFDRKAKEILLSMRLERYFSKDQILEAYLNVVPFGRNAAGQNVAGISAAAKGVFGVKAENLSIPQAAFLAGLPKNPFTYTPYQNSGKLKKDLSAGIDRAHLVLKRMLDSGYLTKKQYHKAMDYNYKKHFKDKNDPKYSKYPAIVEEVKQRASVAIAKTLANNEGYKGNKLEKAYNKYEKWQVEANSPYILKDRDNAESVADYHGYSESFNKYKKNHDLFAQFLKNASNKLNKAGYHIHTTINKKIYDAFQKSIANYNNYQSSVTEKEDGKQKTYPMQVGATLIRNKDGALISFVPGRSKDESSLNFATDIPNPNGSTMKPLLDYAPAMEHGIIQPGSMLADLPSNTLDLPRNYDNEYEGFMTARKALYKSRNVTAYKLFVKAKQQYPVGNYLEQMGMTNLVGSDKTNNSSAIGGLTLGITPEENTNAFTTFANNGKFVDAYMISKITDKDGNTIYKHKTKAKKVFSPQTAYLTTDMLRDVLDRGTAVGTESRLKFSSDWAGKTGTTNGPKGYGTLDNWFVGYNPNVTLGIWTGYEKNKSYLADNYANRTQSLWAGLVNSAYDVKPQLMDPKERFNMPTGIVKRSFCGITGGVLTDACNAAGFAVTDLFNTKYVPDGSTDAFGQGTMAYVGNGKKVSALPQTPKEFTVNGKVISKEFIKNRYPYVALDKVKSDQLKGVGADTQFKADQGSPAAPGGLSYGNGVLKWSDSQSKDVVGYRIYRASGDSNSFKEIGHVRSNEANKLQVGGGYNRYYVAAVDITGKTSGKTNVLTSGEPKKPEDKPTGGDNKSNNDSDSKNDDHNNSDDSSSDDSSSDDSSSDDSSNDDNNKNNDSTNDNSDNDKNDSGQKEENNQKQQ